MSMPNFSKKILPAVIGIVICAAAFTGRRAVSQKTPVELYVFDSCGGCNVQNPCKPCTLFNNLTNKYKLVLKENNLLEKTEFKPYNIYFNNDAEAYRRNMAAIGLEEIPSLPAMVIGGRLISGEEELDTSLVAALKAERGFIPLLKQSLGFEKKEKTTLGVYDEKTIVNFSLAYCEDCKKTDALLENFPGVNIIKIDPSDNAGRTLYEKYCETYGVPVNDYAVPRLFVQNYSFLGYGEASSSLETALGGISKTIKIEVE